MRRLRPRKQEPPSLGESEIAALKDEAVQAVQDNSKLAQVINDTVFSFGELGFQEVETSRYLRHTRRERLPDRARHRRYADRVDGDLGIGQAGDRVRHDIDCIPKASQKPGVAYHDPLSRVRPATAKATTPVSAQHLAALAVKKIMERESLPVRS